MSFAPLDLQYRTREQSLPIQSYELSTNGEINDGRPVFLPPLWLSADHNQRTYELSRARYSILFSPP
jgi:hypothetical protein